MNDFNLDFPISFVKKEQRIIGGIATADNIDKTGDVVDFEASLEAFKSWAGNIREMHNPIAVGKAISYEPIKVKDDDGNEYNAIKVEAYISKGAQDTWEKVLDGTLRAFSIGGSIVEKQADSKRFFRGKPVNIIKKYRLGELSLVDNPANSLATVDIVKRNPDGDLEYVLEQILEKAKKQPLKDPKGGLTAAGRRHFKQTEGANLKPGVKGPADTPEKMRRKGSFLTRFFTNPSGPMKDEKGRPTRLALSAAAWGEPVPQNAQDAAALAAKGRRLLERYQKIKDKNANKVLEEDHEILEKEIQYFMNEDYDVLLGEVELDEEMLETALKSLDQWFREDWVDISRPKPDGGFEPCGRPDAGEGKYPKCVPASRAAKMTQAEIDSAVRRKRRAESRRTSGDRTPIYVPTKKAESVNVPANPELYARVKAEAKAKFRVYPSVYANAWLVREYKKRGGTYRISKEGEVTTSSMGSGIKNPTQGYGRQTAQRKRGRKPFVMKKNEDESYDLSEALSNGLSNALVLYFAAHRAHWNVQGPDFFQYHEMFGKIYEDIYDSLDDFAENVRKLGAFPPSLGEMEDSAEFEDDSSSSDARALALNLYVKNALFIQILKDLFNIANDADEQGIANFIAERIDMHSKWDWQLKSALMASGIEIPSKSEDEDEEEEEEGDMEDGEEEGEMDEQEIMNLINLAFAEVLGEMGKAAHMKTENGEKFPAEAFAYVPDPSSPSTWKLRLWETVSSKETAAQVGRAIAAIGEGFRGNKVEIPTKDMPKVRAKILTAWKRTHPDASREDIPDMLKYENNQPMEFIKMQDLSLQNDVEYDTVTIMNEQDVNKLSLIKRMVNWLIPDTQENASTISTVEVSETTQEEDMDIEVLKDALSAVVDEKLATFATSIKEEVEASVNEKIDSLTKSFEDRSADLQQKLDAAEKALADQDEQVKAFGKSGAIKKSVDPEDDDEGEQIVKSEPASVWSNVYLPQGMINALGYRS